MLATLTCLASWHPLIAGVPDTTMATLHLSGLLTTTYSRCSWHHSGYISPVQSPDNHRQPVFLIPEWLHFTCPISWQPLTASVPDTTVAALHLSGHLTTLDSQCSWHHFNHSVSWQPLIAGVPDTTMATLHLFSLLTTTDSRCSLYNNGYTSPVQSPDNHWQPLFLTQQWLHLTCPISWQPLTAGVPDTTMATPHLSNLLTTPDSRCSW